MIALAMPDLRLEHEVELLPAIRDYLTFEPSALYLLPRFVENLYFAEQVLILFCLFVHGNALGLNY